MLLLTPFLAVARLLLRRLIKTALRWTTGRCELERVTRRDARDITTVVAVRTSLLNSRMLAATRLRTVVNTAPFDAALEFREIVRVKRFSNVGLWFALTALRRTNVALTSALDQSRLAFEEREHEPLLRELWTSLADVFPSSPPYTRRGTHWARLGFQGLDPVTDLRGAGVLGLCDLVYFATKHRATARAILIDFGDVIRGGFPFALVSINLTAFLIEACATIRALDDVFVFLDHVAGSPPPTSTVASPALVSVSSERTPLLSSTESWTDTSPALDDETQVDALDRFHAMQAFAFGLFARRWREARCENAMAFPIFFKGFRAELLELASTRRGIELMSGRVVRPEYCYA